MPLQRLLKHNEANVALQKALVTQANAAAALSSTSAKKAGATTGAVGRPPKAFRGTKRVREEVSLLIRLCFLLLLHRR